ENRDGSADAGGIDLVTIDRLRQREVSLGAPLARELATTVIEVPLDREHDRLLVTLRRRVESRSELGHRPVRRDPQCACQRDSLARQARCKAETNDAPLDHAVRGGHRVRFVRGRHQCQATDSIRTRRCECQCHHPAVRRADDRIEAFDLQQVQDSDERVGLVVRGDAFVWHRPVDAEHAEATGVDGCTGTDQQLPPAVFGTGRGGGDVTTCGDAAEHGDNGCTGGPAQFPAGGHAGTTCSFRHLEDSESRVRPTPGRNWRPVARMPPGAGDPSHFSNCLTWLQAAANDHGCVDCEWSIGNRPGPVKGDGIIFAAMAGEYIFTMRDLRKVVPPQREILKGIYLSFYPGAKIGVIGSNGSGKSTLLRIMAGVDTDFLGEAKPLAGTRIGYLPQEPELDPTKDVRGNVEEAVAEIRALLTQFEEISAKFAEP